MKFPASSKQAIDEMVKSLATTFGRRIDALSWMSPATKVKAKEKLSTLRVGIGYPDSFRDESGLSIVRGDAFGNLERAELCNYRVNVAKLGRAVDRGEWAMFPQEVNAVTGDQQIFVAYAQCWQSKARDEALRESLATNGHAPARYRVLTVRNLDDWYAAFAVEPRDSLYLAPEKRVRVW